MKNRDLHVWTPCTGAYKCTHSYMCVQHSHVKYFCSLWFFVMKVSFKTCFVEKQIHSFLFVFLFYCVTLIECQLFNNRKIVSFYTSVEQCGILLLLGQFVLQQCMMYCLVELHWRHLIEAFLQAPRPPVELFMIFLCYWNTSPQTQQMCLYYFNLDRFLEVWVY